MGSAVKNTLTKGRAEVIPTRAAYVCNLMTESVSVIDLDTRTLVQNIRVGKYPIFSLGFPHAFKKVIVTLHNIDSKEEDALLELVDLNTLDVQKIQYPETAIPSGMTYDDRRDTLFVADENKEQGYVHVHDGKTLKKLSSLPAGRGTVHLDISSDGKHLVATNRLSADLSLFDLEKDPVTHLEKVTIPLGTPNTCHPFDVKFSGNHICYVTDFRTGELLVIDIIRRMVTDRIKVGENLFGMSLDRNGATAYVCNLAKRSVYIVDLNSKKVDEVEGLDGLTSHCVIDEKNHQLVVACQGGGSGGAVDFVDLKTRKVIAAVMGDMIQACIGVTIVEEAIMATEVVNYHILFYGGPEGYQTNRAQIALYGPQGNTVAFIRFNDPGMTFENDSDSGGIVKMHLPSAMFGNVLDVLRNEKPVNIYFSQGRGFLSTAKEPVGEGE